MFTTEKWLSREIFPEHKTLPFYNKPLSNYLYIRLNNRMILKSSNRSQLNPFWKVIKTENIFINKINKIKQNGNFVLQDVLAPVKKLRTEGAGQLPRPLDLGGRKSEKLYKD